ncbi:MAG: hypothetical protein ABSG42_09155 [Nitrospirota bacterium]
MALGCALPVELSGLKKRGFRKIDAGGIGFQRGDIHGMDVAIFVSGIGGERAYRTVKAACGTLPLSAYIQTGFSAGLTGELAPGDIVTGEKVIDAGGDGRVYEADPGLLEAACRAFGERCNKCSFLAVERTVVLASEKKRLGIEYGCSALDMESAGAARAAFEERVPFISIRAISDGADEDLPLDFNLFMKDGALDWPKFLLHVALHPGVVPPLLRLGRQSRLAAIRLAGALDGFLGELSKDGYGAT